MDPSNNEPNEPIDEIDVELNDQQEPARQPLYAQKRGNKKRIVLIVVAVVAVLALVGGAAYWWFAVRDTGAQEDAATEEVVDETEQERETPSLSPAEAAEMVTFNSEELELEFNHRRDWTVTESEDKSEIVLSSPPVGYQTIDGSVPESQGVFTLKIRRGVDQSMRDTINNANAVRDSELVAYDEPTEAQRHYTNISYAGREDVLNFLIVTGSVEYSTGDPLGGTLPLGDAFYLVAGGFGEDADGTLGFDNVPPSQADSQVVLQATAIIESLKLY